MNNQERQALIQASWQLHAQIEASYLADPAAKGSAEWSEKHRLLLADMAIHLLQSALKPGDLDTARLAQNLYAILVVADDFLPESGMKNFSQELLLRTAALSQTEVVSPDN